MRTLGEMVRALWHGLDVLRRFLHLLFLLAIAGLVLGMLRSNAVRIPAHAALVLHPSGMLVEQLSSEPLERVLQQAPGAVEAQTLLWDLTTAVRAAATDPRISALVIETDDLSGTGQVKLEELAAAIAEFRKSGKRVLAYGTHFTQSQYYVASQADEIYLDPFGFVLLSGYGRYRSYYKDALDRLGVDVHLFRVGKFKSAAEPFIRNDMSAEDRVETESYLNALWDGYLASIGRARGLSSDALAQYANNYARAVAAAGGATANLALQAHLVTAVQPRPQFDERLTALVGNDEQEHHFNQVTVDDYLRGTDGNRRWRGSGSSVAIVEASGEILDGVRAPGEVGGESTSALLRQARFDKDVRAVVLRIDSPGGSVQASEQIYREVQQLRQAGKPVVASMSDLAASGGYYIAAPTDVIFASRNTITGSIGVFGGAPTIDRTLGKVGVHVDGIGTTPLAGALRIDRPMSNETAAALQSVVDHQYGEFIARVASGRHQTAGQVEAIAQGRVWAGSVAGTIGLVDHFGSLEDAISEAGRRANLGNNPAIRRLEPDMSLAQQLMSQLRSDGVSVGQWLGLVPRASQLPLIALAPEEHELLRWQHLLTGAAGVYAYCACSVQ